MNKRFLKQAQQLQRQMARVQEDLESATVEGSAGGGVVRAVVTGKMRLESIHIDPEAAAEDVAMLEDLVAAAVNDALERAQEMAAARMGALTGGLNIPGPDLGACDAGRTKRGGSGKQAHRRVPQAAGDRSQDRSEAGLSPHTHAGRRGPESGRGDRLGKGPDRPVRRVIRHNRIGPLLDLR